MDSQMAYLHKDWWCNLRKHFKEYGGELDLNMESNIPTQKYIIRMIGIGFVCTGEIVAV